MGESQVAVVVSGVVVFSVIFAIATLYAWSMFKHHDNEAERVLGIVMLTKLALAILCLVALIIVGIVVALT